MSNRWEATLRSGIAGLVCEVSTITELDEIGITMGEWVTEVPWRHRWWRPHWWGMTPIRMNYPRTERQARRAIHWARIAADNANAKAERAEQLELTTP